MYLNFKICQGLNLNLLSDDEQFFVALDYDAKRISECWLVVSLRFPIECKTAIDWIKSQNCIPGVEISNFMEKNY